MWECAICRRENDDVAPVCLFCSVRRGHPTIRHDSLLITHATSIAAYESIQRTGFELRDPTAGRSLGDVIYGYVYDGGSMFGSLQHAVGACREKQQTDVAVVRIAPVPGASRIFVFDQPRWQQVLDANRGANGEHTISNYRAFLLSHPGNEVMRTLADRAKQERLREITDHPYSRTERDLKDAELLHRQILDDLSNRARAAGSPEARNAIFEQMGMRVEALRHIDSERERLAENFREDALSNAAREAKFDGFYNLTTRIIIFFDPRNVACGDLILVTPVPEVLLDPGRPYEERKAATAELAWQADPAGARAFAAFLEMGDASSSTSSFPVSDVVLPPGIVSMGSLDNTTQPCSSSMSAPQNHNYQPE